uniref:60S ribosomal protein L11 n=1 Tax=Pleurostomum flabellatum TaxID=405751 RepID=A0A7T0Q4Y9_9EUKA|nr:60S ribosomal protein L11 [Pleurostomum flabellatum]QPL15621.1 60S ribosomal protein L11 [Pleurostomum flabellatum]
MKLLSLVRLKIFSKEASSKEPVGPTLGQFGIPIMDFCKKFNSITDKFLSRVPLRVVLFNYGGQKYDFIIRFPDFQFFLKLIFGVSEGCKKPKKLNRSNYILPITRYILFELVNYVCLHDFQFSSYGSLNKTRNCIKLRDSMYSGGFFLIN